MREIRYFINVEKKEAVNSIGTDVYEAELLADGYIQVKKLDYETMRLVWACGLPKVVEIALRYGAEMKPL